MVKLEIKYSTYYRLAWYLPACVIKDESWICSLDLSEKIWAHRAQYLVGHSFSGAHPALVWAWEWKPLYMCTLDDPFAHPSPGFMVYFSSSSFYSNFVHSIPKLYKAGNQNHKIQVQGSSIFCAYWKKITYTALGRKWKEQGASMWLKKEKKKQLIQKCCLLFLLPTKLFRVVFSMAWQFWLSSLWPSIMN